MTTFSSKFFLKNLTLGKYTISLLYLNLARLISGFFMYHWIDPYWMGVWQTMILIQTYFGFTKLGVINGMNRELPFFLGVGKKKLAVALVNSTLFYNIVNICFFLLVILFGNRFVSEKNFMFPLITIFIVMSGQTYNTFLQGIFRSFLKFNTIANALFIEGTLRLVSIIIIYYYNFDGFLIREISIVIIMTTFLHLYRPVKFKPIYRKEIFILLIKTGFPIFLFSYIIQLADTIPRFVILKHLDITSLGLYAPAATILGVLMIVPNSLTSYFYPKLTKELGEFKSVKDLFKKILYIHFSITLLLIPLILIAWFVLPLIIDVYLPKYTNSVLIIHLVLIATLFLGFRFGYTSLVIIKSRKYMMLYSFLFLFYQILFPSLFFYLINNINGIIIGMIVSFFVMFLTSFVLNYYAYNGLKYEKIK